MPTNNLLTFASADGSLVQSDAAYAADTARQTGFQNGIADPAHVNKVWRQGAFGSSVLGQLVTTFGLVDANDDGNVPGFLSNLRMSLAAMLAGVYFGQDTSTTANALAVTLDPAPPTLTGFRSLYVRVANTNTGPVTIALNTIGAKTATRRNGTALQAGDLPAGQIAHFLFDQAAGQFVLAGLGAAEVPRVVTAPVLYVRPDGNDTTGDGSANTAAKAFATISAAIAYGRTRLFLAGQTLTIQLSASSLPAIFTAPGSVDCGGATVLVQGDQANQANYTIQGAGPSSGGSALVAAVNGSLLLLGLTVLNTSAINSSIAAVGAGSITLTNVSIQTSVTGSPSLLLVSSGGRAVISGGCIMGGAAQTMWTINTGTLTMAANVTMANSPTYTSSTISAANCGVFLLSGAFTFGGSGASGVRYSVTTNSVINTNGAGASFIPGNSAGTTGTGGQYV